jgi:hypothetical protein
MNRLLAVTALIEITTGLALLIVPSIVVLLLLGSPLDAFAAVTLGRVAGVAVLTLGVACWFARGEMQSRIASGLVAAMVIYNLGVALILGTAGIMFHPVAIALWPAVALHAAMTFWCIMSFLGGHLRVENESLNNVFPPDLSRSTKPAAERQD